VYSAVNKIAIIFGTS